MINNLNSNMSSEGDAGGNASDFNQRDENVSFFPHNHLDPTLTESQKDFLKYE